MAGDGASPSQSLAAEAECFLSSGSVYAVARFECEPCPLAIGAACEVSRNERNG